MKKSVFVGVDISKNTLDICFYNAKGQKQSEFHKVNNNKTGFMEMYKALQKRTMDLTPVIICFEACGVYNTSLCLFLEEIELDYTRCNALHIKRTIGIVRGKTDKLDAYQIARFISLHHHEIKPTKLPLDAIRKMKYLLSERFRIVKARTAEKNALSEHKDFMCPCSIKRVKKRILSLDKDIKAIETELKKVIDKNEDIKLNYNLLTSIVGISLINASLFITSTNNFKDFDQARKYACYCGVAPFEHTSGTSIRGRTKVSKLANKRIKSELTNAARSAIVHDPELRIYYMRKKDEGKAHGTMMNAVKFKLITRAFAVIKRGTPYVKLRQAG